MNETRLSLGRVALNAAHFPGDGPPLVLLHGLVRRWQDFATILPALTPRYSVTAVDHRGHGKSDHGLGAYLVTDYIADAVELIRSRFRQPVILYGHSLGALTAIAAASECPELVRAVVMEDPPSAGFIAGIEGTSYAVTWKVMRERAGNPDLRGTLAALAAVRFADGRTLGELRDAASLRFLARCIVDLDPDTLGPALAGQWLNGWDQVEAARRVTCPVLLLASDPAVGGMLPAQDAATLTAALDDVSLVRFLGCGHLLHGEHPEAVLRVVTPFLESL